MDVPKNTARDALPALVTVAGPLCPASLTKRPADVGPGHGSASVSEPENCMRQSQEVATSCRTCEYVMMNRQNQDEKLEQNEELANLRADTSIEKTILSKTLPNAKDMGQGGVIIKRND